LKNENTQKANFFYYYLQHNIFIILKLTVHLQI